MVEVGGRELPSQLVGISACNFSHLAVTSARSVASPVANGVAGRDGGSIPDSALEPATGLPDLRSIRKRECIPIQRFFSRARLANVSADPQRPATEGTTEQGKS